MKILGRHVVADFYDADPTRLNDLGFIEKELLKAVKASGASVIDSIFHSFSPVGVTGVVVIKESHFSIHTWPEHGYAAVDLFTCGDNVDPLPAFEELKSALGGRFEFREIKRGLIQG